MPQRPPSKPQTPTEVLDNLCLGYNGYTSPTLTNPKMWAAAKNAFGGAFGLIQRARFANVANFNPPSGLPFTSLKFYSVPGTPNFSFLLADINGLLFAFNTAPVYAVQQRLNPYVDPAGAGSALLNGPFSREVLQSIAYEMNGQVKFTGRGSGATTIEGWGLDAPDVSAQVTITAGTTQAISSIARSNGVVTLTVAGAIVFPTAAQYMNITGVSDSSFNGTFLVTTVNSPTDTIFTFNQLGQNTSLGAGGLASNAISKAIGRSYAWAWENANKVHIGAPSPATQFIQYNNQNSTMSLVELGTVAGTGTGSQTVTGTNTQFTTAWVGRYLWVVGQASVGRITAVSSPTSMTVVFSASFTFSGQQFMVYDPQSTHIRLYATADGGATYFRIARNTWSSNLSTLLGAGLVFGDTANSEPPNAPFTTETAQTNNLPPPIGKFVNEYQGVLLVYGVAGALQSFFYSNQTATSIGLLQESYAPLNQVTLPLQNAQINGMAEFPGALIMWSDKQDMFRLTGLLTDNTVTGVAQSTSAVQQGASIARLPYNLGCATPFAAEITPLGGIWLTSNAEVWLYTDVYAPRNIGRPIQDILNSITPANLGLARMKYYHTNNRNWLVLSVAANGASANNTLLILDLDLLASNGSPSYFTFDMASNSPAWWVYSFNAASLEVVYETTGLVRLLGGTIDAINDADYQGGAGTELAVSGGSVTFHAWGNDSAFLIKRPSWVRFVTNRPPSQLASDGWSFAAFGIDDDVYTFASPLTLSLTPGVNDVATLGGNPDFATSGLAFRYGQGLYKFGGVNFMMGRRIKFQVNFPSTTGINYQFESIQLGFGASGAN